MAALRQMAVLACLVLAAPGVMATTCSCANVPLLGTMELATPEGNKWIVTGTYEFHDASELVSGSSTIPDATGRDRTSEALVMELSRGLGGKFSVSAMLAAVTHDRTVGGESTEVSGLGDAIAMVKYSPSTLSIYSPVALSFGVGAQLPLGKNDAASDGIVLAEDLQPSTGAFAGILWAYAARALNEQRSARVFATASYSRNGENDRDYRFGHAATASIGASYQTQTPWGFNLELLYRRADRDERDGTSIPNTGGKWLDLAPAIQYHLNESTALRLSGKIPLARDLNDELQFTTRYAVRLTISTVFGD